MASKRKKSVSITKYKSKREMNIGILLFFVISIYLLITIFSYATNKRISVYEVREGSIVKDNSYKGLVIRDEIVVNAEKNGYVSYFQNENSKVKNGSNIYALSSEILDTESVAEEAESVVISDEIIKSVVLKVQSANQSYNPQKFSNINSVKNEISTTLQNASDYTKRVQLDTVIQQNSANVEIYNSVKDGVLVLTIDGYESVTENDISEETFDYSKYSVIRLNDQMKIESGQPVYKLVTGENWQVYIQLSEEKASELSELTVVKTKIDKDNETIWADFSIIVKDGKYYGCLSYDNSMIRYADERFLNVELILADQTGLKIPKTALVEKEFYIVPEDYLTTSGSSEGVLVMSDNEAVFKSADIYNISEDGYLYLNPEEFEEGTIFVKPESVETYMLEEKRLLEGVYNINKGYAVFRKIEILCENDEYYIVDDGSSYGLSNYDHIVQNGDTVKENEVVFQ